MENAFISNHTSFTSTHTPAGEPSPLTVMLLHIVVTRDIGHRPPCLIYSNGDSTRKESCRNSRFRVFPDHEVPLPLHGSRCTALVFLPPHRDVMVAVLQTRCRHRPEVCGTKDMAAVDTCVNMWPWCVKRVLDSSTLDMDTVQQRPWPRSPSSHSEPTRSRHEMEDVHRSLS